MALFLVLAAGLPVIAQEAKDDVKKAIKELEGAWVVESAVDSKEDVGSELGMEYVFEGERIRRQSGRGVPE